MKIKTIPIDSDDMGIESAADVIESTVNAALASFDSKILSVQVIPANQTYTLPSDDGSWRDYHYRETGFIAVVVYEEK